ncbi:phage baseplate protein [Dialister invisus]|uniref:phage baseplate protein n=1 Tax=Dialister invisus TaxID=218538 RepID=UPI003080F6CA
MPYTEKYPLNPTPQGDSTKDAVLKNREEIKTIGNALSAQSKGGGSGLRQRILYGKNSGGKYSFLSGDGLSVIIDGSMTPVILTLADGFDENGAKDYVETINKKISAWTLPINATNYLFVERNNVGALSYGSVTTKPVFSDSLPSGIVTNTHVFNTLEQKMYYYNGTEWKAVVRVFVAAVTTNATSVTKIEYYQHTINADQLTDKSVTSNKIGDGEIKTINIDSKAVITDKIGDKQVTKSKLGDDVLEIIDNMLNKVYPIGSIYCSTVSTNPNVLFGVGKWAYIEQGRVLLSQGNTYQAGSVGGEKTHVLTIQEMPKHNHSGMTENAGDHTHTGTTSRAELIGGFGYDAWANHSWGIVSEAGGAKRRGAAEDNASADANKKIDASHAHTFATSLDGKHSHSIKIEMNGGSSPHNIMQPYLAVYMWKRIG